MDTSQTMIETGFPIQKAQTPEEISSVLRLDAPLTPDHPFWVDLAGLRGTYNRKEVYRFLGLVDEGTSLVGKPFDGPSPIMCLSSPRGYGKTTELNVLGSIIQDKDAFFVVRINLDEELDLASADHRDIFALLISRLSEEFRKSIKNVDKSGWGQLLRSLDNILSYLETWEELSTNQSLEKHSEISPKIRIPMDFPRFVHLANEFIQDVQACFQEIQIAKRICFIIDGAEKFMDSKARENTFLQLAQNAARINAQFIIALPLELKSLPEIRNLSLRIFDLHSIRLPYQSEKDFHTARNNVRELVLSRITENSFEQIEVVDQAFEMSGGVPRELFRILSYANVYRGNLNRISAHDIEFAATKLGSEWSRYLTLEDLSVLKEIDSGEIRQPESAKDEIFNLVGEGILLFDPLRSKLRIAPLIKRSEIFRQLSISFQDQEEDSGDLQPEELGQQTQIFDPSQVNIETRLLSIHHLMKKIEAGEIELNDKIYPNKALSQWNNQKQSSFLESILIKLPIPPIYIDASKPGKWIVIDGAKRLRAIQRFLLEQELPLRLIRLEFLEDLEGKLFRELDLPTQRALEESNMQTILISQGTPFNIKFSIYKRLNSSYGDLNSQQIRNLLFNGPATAFLGKLAEVDALKEISSGKLSQYPQMHDREFANRFLAFYLWGFEDYRGDMDAFLNKAMAEIVRLDMQKRLEVLSRFEESLHFVKSVLGTPALNQIVWSSYTLPRYLPINKSLVEVLTVCFATQMDYQRAVLREKKDWFSAELGELIIIDKELRIALTASPSNHEMIKYRFRSLYNLIQRALQ